MPRPARKPGLVAKVIYISEEHYKILDQRAKEKWCDGTIPRRSISSLVSYYAEQAKKTLEKHG